LGQYFANDFLYIKDFSIQLKKQHNIKVEEDRKETYKTLLNEFNYKDIGTREINLRLQQSSAGKNKILLIENIERMTISAINAFLKACEEPLPNRIIIATTTNKSQILDTVISRAITIDASQYNNAQNKQSFAQDISSVTKLLATDTNIHNKHKLLSEINKK
jgi:DNA polymerase III delta prime subunit